jgi:Collagen triple helix repeat (20 copies)
MKYLVLSMMLMCACRGPRGDQGVQGNTGAVGQTGATGSTGAAGANGQSIVGPQGPAGINGTNGTNGTNATPVTVVQFCPNDTPTYPSTFPEYGICLSGQLYGVYSANGGFLALLPPGQYISNAIGSTCTFTIQANCIIQ